MADPRFFTNAGPFTLADLAERTDCELVNHDQDDQRVIDVAPLDQAGSEHVSFLDNRKYVDIFEQSRAGACFVHPDMIERAPKTMALLVSKTPYKAYALAAQAFYPHMSGAAEISDQAIIDDTATIGPECRIEPGVVISAHAEIGARCHIGANTTIGQGVVVGDDCRISSNVTLSHCLIGTNTYIYPGARIGQDGFGFAMDPGGHVRIPQLGRVIIGDNVEIGANTTIDRGAGPDTVIGNGVMIDNQVQLGHNVQIGDHSVLVAQCGVSGSAKLDEFVVIGGQSGIGGHLNLGPGARVAAHSGVMRDVPAGQEVGGAPAMPIKEAWKRMAVMNKLIDDEIKNRENLKKRRKDQEKEKKAS